MLNIAIRQNDKFTLGYPYNHAVDAFFEPLTNEFINIYNLDQYTINAINNYKNDVYSFDNEVHSLLFELSAFIMSFETNGMQYQREYDSLKLDRINQEASIKIIDQKHNELVNEFAFISESVDTIGVDIEKIRGIIQFYKSKIISSNTTYDREFISNLTEDINNITTVINDTTLNLDYYKTNVLYKSINDYLQYVNHISKYSFSDTHIRNMYESWSNNDNPTYYSAFINYFKPEYESAWTYGSSLIFSENLDYVTANKETMLKSGEYLGSLLLKKSMFEIELDTKKAAENYVDTHINFNESDFNKFLYTEKRRTVENKISHISSELIQEKTNLRLILSKKQEQDYSLYQELIIEKRRYIYNNISNLDSVEIEKFDTQINALELNYKNVKLKLESMLYWEHFCLVQSLTLVDNELKKELESINNWFNSTNTQINKDDATEIEAKIVFYEKELSDLNNKLSEMIIIKDKLDISVNTIKDNKTLADSILFENKQITSTLMNTYTDNFIERLAFFTQDIDNSISSSIFVLLNNDFYRDLNTKFNKLKNYERKIPWIDDNHFDLLFSYYESIIGKIYTTLEHQWKIEFDHEILSFKKFDYYKEYFDSTLRVFYATIHNYINTKIYSPTIYNELNIEVDKLEKIFSIYNSIAFIINRDITIGTDIYNYDNSLLFNISDDLETEKNVTDTFNAFLNNILIFVYDINENLKYEIENIKQIENINLLWDDMEQKNV